MKHIMHKFFYIFLEGAPLAVWLLLTGLQLLALVAGCAVCVLGAIWLVRALLGWI